MKKISIFFELMVLLTFFGCGTSNSVTTLPAPTPSPTPGSSILSQWTSSDPSLTLSIDFSQVTLGTEGPASSLVTCDGTYDSLSDSTTQINGVDPGDILISGTATSGTIQVGNLQYVGASNSFCEEASKEPYTYQVANGVLTFCSVNYNTCGTFVPAQ